MCLFPVMISVGETDHPKPTLSNSKNYKCLVLKLSFPQARDSSSCSGCCGSAKHVGASCHGLLATSALPDTSRNPLHATQKFDKRREVIIPKIFMT